MGLFGNDERDDNALDMFRAVDSAAIHDAILSVIRQGGLISFSASRDGYAASVQVIFNGHVARKWVEDPAAFQKALEGLVTADLAAEVAESPKRSESGRRRS